MSLPQRKSRIYSTTGQEPAGGAEERELASVSGIQRRWPAVRFRSKVGPLSKWRGAVAVAQSCEKEIRMQRMKQVPDRYCVRRLGPGNPTRGRALSEDIPRERAPWANTEAGTRGDVERRVQREYQVPIGAASDGLALRVPTRGKAQSEDIPTERTP